jgi:hypothetical protein
VQVESPTRKRGSRFVCISDRESSSGRSHGNSAEARIGWRLLAPNNRALGRSAATYDTVLACQEAAVLLHTAHALLQPSITVGSDGRWSWSIGLDGTALATSASVYFRRMEVTRALHLFRETVATTEVRFDEVRDLGLHGPRSFRIGDLGPVTLTPAGVGWA